LSARITNIEKVLDPWMVAEADQSKRVAVLDALASAITEYPRLFARPAVYGHPLKRLIEVPEAEVTILVLLTHPHVGIHLLAITRI
jgi:hypothetical protein